MTTKHSPTWRAPRAFTLTELIIVVGVLAMLIGLIAPALSSVKTQGRLTEELSAARQLMVAWTNYASVNRDQVLPGYKTGLPALTEDGRSVHEISVTTGGAAVAARYPWRIAPFLDYQFRGLYKNEQAQLLESMEQENEEYRVYIVSLSPSLGYNATWIGGHQNELGFNQAALKAYGRFYVTRVSEVRRPDRLMTFGSARGVDPVAALEAEANPTGPSEDSNPGVVEGYYEIRSPFRTASGGDRWAETYAEAADPADFGFLSLRYNDEAVASFVDCHVTTLNESSVRDMRHWANRAEAYDYGLVANQP